MLVELSLLVYGLLLWRWATGWTIGVLEFDSRRGLGSPGAHPASYPVGTRGSFPGGKTAGA